MTYRGGISDLCRQAHQFQRCIVLPFVQTAPTNVAHGDFRW
jgi:hypothetical protein